MKLNLKYLLWSVMILAAPMIVLIVVSERSAFATSPDPVRSTSLIFTDTTASGLDAVRDSAVAWADYDGDGHLDVLLAGQSASGPIAKVYRKKPGEDSYQAKADLIGVSHGAVAWGDYNNDNQPDILLTGQVSPTLFISKIYRNNNGETFTDIGAALPGVSDGSVAWGDYDNDGKQDILLAGDTLTETITKIYHNDGNGIFSDSGVSLRGINHGTVAWGDYNNDGRLDILLTGSRFTEIYRNEGNGGFGDIISLSGLHNSSAAWGDYNNDGLLDIALTGLDDQDGAVAKLYRNTGNGFTEVANSGLVGDIYWSAVAWGDYDNDGRLDLLMSGNVYVSTKVCHNEDNGTFNCIVDSGLPSVDAGAFAWGDYDDSGTLDVLIAGRTATGRLSSVYGNVLTDTNSAPNAPTGLTATVISHTVTLQWNAPSGDETPPAGLTYNLRLGTTPVGVDIVSPLAITDTGYRKIPAFGNQYHITTTTLSNLPRGAYYWSVQAIDSAFAGSPFAEGRFVVPYYIRIPLVAGNYTTYFEGPWESEPNNSRDEANGPIRSGQPYYGYPNDQKDYFSFYVRNPGTISMTLANHTGQGVQLQLHYGDTFLTYVYAPPFHIEYAVDQPGWYYVYIFTESGWNGTTPYTLTVTYPP